MLFAGVATARDYTCPGDFADLNEAFGTLSGAAGPNTLAIDDATCIPRELDDVVLVNVDVTCNVGGGCDLPPLRVSGGGHFGVSGVSFSATEEFEFDTYDDNSDLFPGYDAVYASLYVDSAELVVHNTAFRSVEDSFGGLVAVDCETTLDHVGFFSPSGHAMKLYADELDVAFSLTNVEVTGAGDSAIRALDSDDGHGAGRITTLSITDSAFTQNSAYYGADLEVFTDGAIVVDHTTFTSTDNYGEGAPVELFGRSVSLTDVTFDDTYGGLVGTFFAGAANVDVTRLTVTRPPASPYLAYLTALLATSIDSSHVGVDGLFYVTGGPAEFTDNTFLLAAGAAASSGIRLDTTSASFSRNFFCGSGPVATEYGLVSGPTELYFEENVFNGLDLLGPLVDTRDDDDVSSSPQGVSFFDNTIVAVSAANLVAGDVAAFVFVNNLVVDSAASFDSSSWRGGVTADYNAWSFGDDTTVTSPDGWGTHDLLGEEPRFVASYDPTACPSLPALSADSPMINRGSPSRTSGDGSRSDIGAVDFGDESGWDSGLWEDTGDSDDTAGGSDRDGDGWVDADDCAPSKPAIHPGAEDVPDDGVDQDCDGVEASTAYTGGCGCDSGAGKPAIVGFLGLTLLVLRKRWE